MPAATSPPNTDHSCNRRWPVRRWIAIRVSASTGMIAIAELTPKYRRLPSLARICTAMPSTAAVMMGRSVSFQRRSHGAVAMQKMHAPTTSTSNNVSTMVDPVGDGPASTTPMPDTTAMPATHAKLMRTSRRCPSVTIC